MKLKITVLITGTLLGVLYLVGCGGGSNNNSNGNCQSGYTWNGSTCVYGAYGTNAYGQGNCSTTPGTIWSQVAGTCVQECNLGGGGVGGIVNGTCQYIPQSNCGGGYQGVGYAGGGYQGGYPGGGYNTGCTGGGYSGGPGYGPGYGPAGYGPGYGPVYPMQQPYMYYQQPNSVYWNLNL